jgi:hypothetical protein
MLLLGTTAVAEERGPIQDNSFLLEEAYNQEPGVIQHISLFVRDRDTGDWVYTFTEEWPAHGLAHQVSATIQVLRSSEGAERATGFGDLALNYRWQAIGSGDTAVAVAPRATVLLPTGDWERGLGTGGAGLQVNLPISAMLGTRFVGHFNLGSTWIPSARTESGRAPSVGVNVGQGLIWLAHPNLNLMLETVYAVTETDAPAGKVIEESFQVSPGIRGALDLPLGLGLQVVGGVAVPIGFGPSSGSLALLGYLSFEHPVTDHPW